MIKNKFKKIKKQYKNKINVENSENKANVEMGFPAKFDSLPVFTLD